MVENARYNGKAIFRTKLTNIRKNGKKTGSWKNAIILKQLRANGRKSGKMRKHTK